MGLIAPDSPATPQSAEHEPSRMLVFADLRIGTQRFLQVMHSLGPCVHIGHGLWALRTFESVAVVRNQLALETVPQDRLMVIDISRDRFAAVNLGPEIESQLRQVWRGNKDDQSRREAFRLAI